MNHFFNFFLSWFQIDLNLQTEVANQGNICSWKQIENKTAKLLTMAYCFHSMVIIIFFTYLTQANGYVVEKLAENENLDRQNSSLVHC